jgi:hypothetical protein
MKVEMNMEKDKHLWVAIGNPVGSLTQAQVIIDLEHLDIRVCGSPQSYVNQRASVVKVRLTPELQVKDLLCDDIFQTDAMHIKKLKHLREVITETVNANRDHWPYGGGPLPDEGSEKVKQRLTAAVDEALGSAKQHELTGAELTDTAKHVDAFIQNYHLDTGFSNPSALRSDLISMVNVAKGGFP